MALSEHETLLELAAGPPTTTARPEAWDDNDGYEAECNYLVPSRSKTREPRKCKNRATTSDPEWLPVCRAHRQKERYRAGRCKAMTSVDGSKAICGKLIRWKTPYFQLCKLHRDQPDEPCHIMKLPPEIRLEIFRWLLPDDRFDSTSSARLHYFPQARPARDFLSILPVNRQIYAEAKDLLYGTRPFIIDIRTQGVFMCGRWIVQPKDEGGNAAAKIANSNSTKQAGIAETADLFMKTFPFSYVKRYRIDIVFEDQGRAWNNWDKEVEVYDLRDYVRFVVLNFPRKSKSLISIETQVVLKQGECSQAESANIVRLLTEPLMDLRGVGNAKLSNVYEGEHYSAAMTFVERNRALNDSSKGFWGPKNFTLCVLQPVPALKDRVLLQSTDPDLAVYKDIWESRMRSRSQVPIESELRRSFSRFKSFYTKFVEESEWVRLEGRDSLLHRARVARENNDKGTFLEVLHTSIAMFLDFKDGQKRSHAKTRFLNRKKELANQRKEKAHEDLASDLLRFLDSFQNSSPTYEQFFPSLLEPVIEIPDDDDETTRNGKPQSRENPHFEILPRTPDEIMQRDYADIEELESFVGDLQRQIRERKRLVQLRWDTLALQTQPVADPSSFAPYLISPSTPGEHDPFRGYDRSQPGTLPTPPSSQSSMHGATMDIAWGNWVAGSSSTAQAGSSSGPSKSSKAASTAVIGIPDVVYDAPRVTPAISYTGKGKGRADVIVLDEDDS